MKISPSMMLKKRIIDEVKMIIAGRKILRSMQMNMNILDELKDRYAQFMIEAEPKIKQAMTAWYYKQLFQRRMRVYVASIYLETSELIKPNAKVVLIGSFTKKPWIQKVLCTYDPLFRCFKADKVFIKVG